MFSSIANGILILFFVLSMSMSIFFLSQLNKRFVSERVRRVLELIFASSFVYIIMILTFHSSGFLFFIYMPVMVSLVSMDRDTSNMIGFMTPIILGYSLWDFRDWPLTDITLLVVILWIMIDIISWLSRKIEPIKWKILFLTIAFIIVEMSESFVFLPYRIYSPNVIQIILVYAVFGVYLTYLSSYSERNKLFQQEAIYTDELTELQNYRAFSELVHQPHDDDNIVILVFDIDHFKEINDENGHVTGNRVLKMVVGSIQKRLNVQDTITKYETYRFGGDEIVVAMWLEHDDKMNEDNIRYHFDAVRKQISQLGHEEFQLDVTISCGVSASRYHHGNLIETFKGADATLYTVKRNSKNGIAFEQDV